MIVGDTLYLVGARALWRLTGSKSAGRALVRALADDDENRRTIAGMLLAKAGPAAQPLLIEALRDRSALPMALSILGDVGDATVEAQIAPFGADEDPSVARAAADALRVLRLRSESRSQGGRRS